MTLVYFILMLGIIVFVHELGHFFWAKKSGVYCYEFSIGFGPKLFSFKRKNDETAYSLRLIPLGGFVAMAGEEIDDDKSVPKDKKMYNKAVNDAICAVKKMFPKYRKNKCFYKNTKGLYLLTFNKLSAKIIYILGWKNRRV